MIAFKMNHPVFVFFLCLVLFNRVAAQDLKIVPPTPNASKMTEYFSQRPNMYTGTANVSIPLHTIDFDGWSLPISISYNAGGVRTNEEAGEVGLGWALNATGVISRTIQGGDDLFPGYNNQYKGFVYNDRAVNSNLNYQYNNPNVAIVELCASGTPCDTTYYKHLLVARPDTQPDLFSYNFFGYNGSFVLTQKVVTGTIKVIKLTKDACKVSFNEGTMSFTVTTPDGYVGEFSVKEKSTTMSSVSDQINAPTWNEVFTNTCWGENHINIQLDCIWAGRFKTTSSWYLAKITSPRKQVITFKYDLNADGSSPYLSNTRSYGEQSSNIPFPILFQTVHEHVYLKRIISESDSVQFNMETREDLRTNKIFTAAGTGEYFPDGLMHNSVLRPLQTPKRYTGITISSKLPSSTFNKNIVFTQSYFNQQYQDQIPGNQSETELMWLRSRLDRVKIDDQEYRFYYEKGTKGIPKKLTSATDHFGFYNGMDANTSMLPPRIVTGPNSCDLPTANYNSVSTFGVINERAPNFEFGKAGLLTKVYYPTQGYTVFEYEPHIYQPDLTLTFREDYTLPGGGARIKSIKEYDYDDQLVLNRSYQYVQTVNSPISGSTGKLMVPLFNRYANFVRAPVGNTTQMALSACHFLYTTGSSIPGNNSAEGKVIGYSKVHEIVEGPSSYRNTYYFENRPNQIVSGNGFSISYPNLNGQATEVRNYNSSGNVVRYHINQDYEHYYEQVTAISYGTSPFDPYAFGYVTPYYLKSTFIKPFTETSYEGDTQTGFTDADIASGIPANKAIQTSKTYTFNSNFLPKTEQVTGSSNDVYVTTFYRPCDYATPSATLKHMKYANMVSPVIEQVQTKNGVVISAAGNRYVYDSLPKGITNLMASYAYNRSLGAYTASTNGDGFGSSYEPKINFNSYDANTGKLLQYTTEDGVIHSFIWGYNSQLPIVHAVGVTYADLSTAYNAAILTPSTYEATLRSHAKTNNKQLTTYVHNPSIGVTKVTDPAGAKNTYEYDAYGRLVLARDTKNAIVGQNKYRLKARTASKILAISGDLNFGTLTTDMYASQTVYYARCSDAMLTKTMTLTNSGDDDLTVSAIQMPTGFIASWSGGKIIAGNSIDVIISFDNTKPIGTYSGTITINSDKTAGPSTTAVSAVYATRSNVIGNPTLVNFGTVSPVGFQNITITNTGNAPLRLAYVAYNWNGVLPVAAADKTNAYFTIPISNQCFGGTAFSNSMTVQSTFTPQFSGTVSATVSLFFDDGTYKQNAFTIQGTKN